MPILRSRKSPDVGMRLFQKILFFFEMRSFGVCEWWAQKFGIQSSRVRNTFIYVSVIGLGSPVVLYFVMAWIKEHKHYFKLQPKRTKSIWQL